MSGPKESINSYTLVLSLPDYTAYGSPLETSVAKCRGSWVVGRGRGSWVWVWVNVVRKKKSSKKRLKLKK